MYIKTPSFKTCVVVSGQYDTRPLLGVQAVQFWVKFESKYEPLPVIEQPPPKAVLSMFQKEIKGFQRF